jgi:hypothetical protein
MTFGQIASFLREWRRLRLTDEDLQALETLIMERPEAGQVMQGTGGLRKIRFAPPSWRTGKSGATRVCYVYFVSAAWCELLMIFSKNQKPNLSAAEKARARQYIADLRRQLEKGR